MIQVHFVQIRDVGWFLVQPLDYSPICENSVHVPMYTCSILKNFRINADESDQSNDLRPGDVRNVNYANTYLKLNKNKKYQSSSMESSITHCFLFHI